MTSAKNDLVHIELVLERVAAADDKLFLGTVEEHSWRFSANWEESFGLLTDPEALENSRNHKLLLCDQLWLGISRSRPIVLGPHTLENKLQILLVNLQSEAFLKLHFKVGVNVSVVSNWEFLENKSGYCRYIWTRF